MSRCREQDTFSSISYYVMLAGACCLESAKRETRGTRSQRNRARARSRRSSRMTWEYVNPDGLSFIHATCSSQVNQTGVCFVRNTCRVYLNSRSSEEVRGRDLAAPFQWPFRHWVVQEYSLVPTRRKLIC